LYYDRGAGATALEGAGTLDEVKAKFYADLGLMVLPEAARSALEAMMTTGNDEVQSELVKRWVREVQEGKADAILELLETRALTESEAQRERMAICRDVDQLSVWLRCAAIASSSDELFG
jgi:hypothetical protein